MAPLTVSRKVAKTILVSCLLVLLVAVTGEKVWGQRTSELMAHNQAESLWNGRHWEQAVLAYEDYLRNYPAGALTAQAHLHIGMYLEHHNRLEEALHHYQAGLAGARGKNFQILQTEIADVQKKFGNHEEAVRIYQEILRRPASWDMFKIANKKLLVLHYQKALRAKQGKRANNCGEESLKIVLQQLGVAPKTDILAKIPTDANDKASLVSLKQAALAHGVESYGLKVTDGQLETLTAPAILLFHPAHFAVFQGISPEGVKIADPGALASQEKTISVAQLKEQWTGYALCFTQDKDKDIQGLTLLGDQEMKGLVGGFHEPGDTFYIQ